MQLVLRPLWDWNEQFSEKDKLFFTNPFYVKRQEISRKSMLLPASAILLPGFKKQPTQKMSTNQMQNHSLIPQVIFF